MHAADSRYAWQRLAASTVLCALGSFSMWGVVVIFPALQAEFAASRADVSFSYTATMVGFGTGVVLFGRLIDARGAFITMLLATVLLVSGCVVAALAPTLWVFVAAQGLLIGFGSAAAFIPLMADISHWFVKRRALAMAISASGNYLGGAIWPKVVDVLTTAHDWRTTYLVIGAICLVAMLPCCLVLRPPLTAAGCRLRSGWRPLHPLDARPVARQPAGLARDRGRRLLYRHVDAAGPYRRLLRRSRVWHGARRGNALADDRDRGPQPRRLRLDCRPYRRHEDDPAGLDAAGDGAARLPDLRLADVDLSRVGAVRPGSQGGIVPSYGVIVREYYPPREAGTRMGITIAATIIGMAVGGWMGGALFDLTGSYRAAFINGFAWNVLNGVVIWWLLTRQGRIAHA